MYSNVCRNEEKKRIFNHANVCGFILAEREYEKQSGEAKATWQRMEPTIIVTERKKVFLATLKFYKEYFSIL